MLLTLEALNAEEGDCLLLCYGTARSPRFILIDGGPDKVYQRTLRPRLRALQKALRIERDPLPLELVLLSHIDDDHVFGVLHLVEEVYTAKGDRKPALVKINELWHNSFDDLVRTDEVEAAMAYLDGLPLAEDDRARGTVSGVRQSQKLRDRARALGFAVNAAFSNLVARPEDAGIVLERTAGLSLTVLGPTRAELAACQKKWDEALAKVRAKGHVAAAERDSSMTNLSSITVLAEWKGKSILLTGDARGDQVLAGLVAAGKLAADGGTLHVDVLKLPHHGSCRNVNADFFRRITADTYVLSANGRYDNPDLATLAWLAAARKGQACTLVCTFPRAAYSYVKGSSASEQKQRAALEAVDQWLTHSAPPEMKVVYREPDQLGVRIDLGDETLGG